MFFCCASIGFPTLFAHVCLSPYKGLLLAREDDTRVSPLRQQAEQRPLKAPPEGDNLGLREARCFLPLPPSSHGCQGILGSGGRYNICCIFERIHSLNLSFSCGSSTLAILLMFNYCVGLQWHERRSHKMVSTYNLETQTTHACRKDNKFPVDIKSFPRTQCCIAADGQNFWALLCSVSAIG